MPGGCDLCSQSNVKMLSGRKYMDRKAWSMAVANPGGPHTRATEVRVGCGSHINQHGAHTTSTAHDTTAQEQSYTPGRQIIPPPLPPKQRPPF